MPPEQFERLIHAFLFLGFMVMLASFGITTALWRIGTLIRDMWDRPIIKTDQFVWPHSTIDQLRHNRRDA